jgi:hypothetical protein
MLMSENIKRDDLSQVQSIEGANYNKYTLAELTRLVDSNFTAVKGTLKDTNISILIQECREGSKHFLELRTDFQYEGHKIQKCMKVELRLVGTNLISYWDPLQECDMNAAFMMCGCNESQLQMIRNYVLATIDQYKTCLCINHKILLRMRELSTQSQTDKENKTTNSSNVYTTPRCNDVTLLVSAVAESIMEKYEFVTLSRRVTYIYEHGVYGKYSGGDFYRLAEKFLGCESNQRHRDAVVDYIKKATKTSDSYFKSREGRYSPIINVKNGLFNVLTGELKPHTPKHFSTIQLPYEWNPSQNVGGKEMQ